MRLSLLGGGGFRVPLVYAALAQGGAAAGLIEELTLYDTDPRRLRVISSVLAQLPGGPRVRTTDDLREALRGADFVFSALRVGGTRGRVRDERIPLDHGVIGQETVGAGGVLYGLRTVPVALDIARTVARVAPEARVINFTNPAGMVTEAMASVLGERVIGICDSPVGLVRRAAKALGVRPETLDYDYVGLNHLGWLRSLRHDGVDLLPALLDSQERLNSFEEGRLFGPRLLRALRALPNEYLHYYYFRRETLQAVAGARETRGEFLARQQEAFFTEAAGQPAAAYELWSRTRREREATYLAESREASGAGERDACDLEGGGYEQVALTLMRALSGQGEGRLILNVRQDAGRSVGSEGSLLPGFTGDAVIETVCEVGPRGARPLPCAPPGPAELGLMLQVKAVERATIEAARTGSRTAALRALALHPLVDSAWAAERILEEAWPR